MRRHSKDQAKIVVNSLTSEMKEKYPNLASSVGDAYLKKVFSQLYRTSVFYKKDQRRAAYVHTNNIFSGGYNEMRT